MPPLLETLPPNPRLQRTRSAPLRSPLSSKTFGPTRIAIAGLFAVLGIGIVPQMASACDCEEGPFTSKEAVQRAGAVFVGRVIEFETVTKPPNDLSHRRVRFRATEAWKGVESSDVWIYVGDGSDCDYPFECEKDYLLFAYGGPPALMAYQCSHTYWLWRSDLDRLEQLRQWQPGKPLAP